MIRILGLDPGSLITGYGVVDYDPARPLDAALVDAGVVRMTASLKLPDRLVQLEAGVVDVLVEHRPDVVAIEEVYTHYKHPRTAIVMGHARGVLMLACRRAGATFLEYAANRVKQSLSGYGHASKGTMQQAIQRQWNLPDPPEPPDVADALAVALCCCRSGDVDDHAAATVPR